MEIWKIILIIFGIIILFIILRKYQKKPKNWLIFEREQGVEGNTKKSHFALNKLTGERRELK